MFYTELEAVENGFILKVVYDRQLKKWAYRYLEELIVHRSRLEHYFVEGDMDTLKEEMS